MCAALPVPGAAKADRGLNRCAEGPEMAQGLLRPFKIRQGQKPGQPFQIRVSIPIGSL